MTLRERVNGQTKFIPIYLFLFAQLVGAIWWASAQNTKVDTLKTETIPLMKSEFQQSCEKQNMINEKLTMLLSQIQDTLIAIRYDNKDIKKDVAQIKKKLKMD